MDDRRYRSSYDDSQANRSQADRERPFMNDRMRSGSRESDSRAQRVQDGSYPGSSRSQRFMDDQSYWESDFNEFGRNPNTNEPRRSFAESNRSPEFAREHGFQGNDFSYGRENYGTRSYSQEPERYSRSTSNESGFEGFKNFFGKGPKGYRRSDDRIREEISEALYRHSAIDASEIEIEVKEGVVTLQGTVEGRRMKRLVEDVVEDVSGVSDVHNNLRLMPLQSSGAQQAGGSSASAPASQSASSSGSTSSKKGSIQ
jgi:hypothetical protein